LQIRRCVASGPHCWVLQIPPPIFTPHLRRKSYCTSRNVSGQSQMVCQSMRSSRTALRGIAQRVPSNRGLPMNKKSRSNRKEDVQSLQLAHERPWQSRDGSNVTYLHTSGAVVHLNQSLLARLEAENAQLRGSVVDLFLQIRASRDGSTSRNRF